mgnify:CR=1 FL=1
MSQNIVHVYGLDLIESRVPHKCVTTSDKNASHFRVFGIESMIAAIEFKPIGAKVSPGSDCPTQIRDHCERVSTQS